MEIFKGVTLFLGGMGTIIAIWSYLMFIKDWRNKKIEGKLDKVLGFLPMGYICNLAAAKFHEERYGKKRIKALEAEIKQAKEDLKYWVDDDDLDWLERAQKAEAELAMYKVGQKVSTT